MQKQQDAACVRGTGDVLVLYGLNVVLAVLMDPLLPSLLSCARVVCLRFVRFQAPRQRVCAIVRFAVSPPWHSWSFSPVSANYREERFCDLSASWQQAIIYSEDEQCGICWWRGVFVALNFLVHVNLRTKHMISAFQDHDTGTVFVQIVAAQQMTGHPLS